MIYKGDNAEMSNAQIEVVQLGDRKYIGIAVTSPLNSRGYDWF